MPKIRSVHPGQWVDDQYVTTTIPARLLSIAVRNFADDNGIFEWNPLKIKMQIFPADPHTIDEMKSMLDELLSSGQVKKYSVDNKDYGIIRNFRLFQSPQKPSFSFPVPDEEMLTNGYELHKKFDGKGNLRLRDKNKTSTVQVSDQSNAGKRVVSDESHTSTVPVSEGDATKPHGVGVGIGAGIGDGVGVVINKKSSSITSSVGKDKKPAAASEKENQTPKEQNIDYVKYFIARGIKQQAAQKPNCLAMFNLWEKHGLKIKELESVINPVLRRENNSVTSPMYFKTVVDEYLKARGPFTNKKSEAVITPRPCLTEDCTREANMEGYCIVCYDLIHKQELDSAVN